MNQQLALEMISKRIAEAIVAGFDRHYSLFRATSASAKRRFETADWQGVQTAVRERIQFYSDRVAETAALLQREFDAEHLDDESWQQAKLNYIGLLLNHKQPETAETFFNSVFCRIMHRTYFHNDFIFVRPAVSTEFIESDPPAYRTYYPNDAGFRVSVKHVLLDLKMAIPFENIDRDVANIYRAIESYVGKWPAKEANLQIQVLSSGFYRNKAVYVIGKAINGSAEYPFAIAVLSNRRHKVFVDTILLDPGLISVLFSLSRAYFMVDMEVPSAYVQFLRSIMPTKPRSEIYTMLGLGKQGKTMFFRDLISHLRHSQDNFIVAPGIPGLVMFVFTLPSYPYVFKIIKDVFGKSKEVDHATVRYKYQLVKNVDRVGRMADTLEFSNAALPLARFSKEVIDELHALAPSLIEIDGDDLVIKHVYIERRMVPLNIYLDQAERDGRGELIDHAVEEYGNAIRELAGANIFPGDMLWKNFGVTRFGRVVFYDYDEIEYMTDCNFRRIPEAPYPEMELSSEPWYSVARNDVFPEEFATFLLVSPRIRDAFKRHHADLLQPEFWQQAQEDIRNGNVRDFFPYPPGLRFRREENAGNA